MTQSRYEMEHMMRQTQALESIAKSLARLTEPCGQDVWTWNQESKTSTPRPCALVVGHGGECR